MKAIAHAIRPRSATKAINVVPKVSVLMPDFKPYLIAGAIILGLMLANQVVITIWRVVTCNC